MGKVSLKTIAIFLFKLVLAGLLAYTASICGLQTYFVAAIVGVFGVYAMEVLLSYLKDTQTWP